eukprot:6710099-Pyramimonas_sp.AAC.1
MARRHIPPRSLAFLPSVDEPNDINWLMHALVGDNICVLLVARRATSFRSDRGRKTGISRFTLPPLTTFPERLVATNDMPVDRAILYTFH